MFQLCYIPTDHTNADLIEFAISLAAIVFDIVFWICRDWFVNVFVHRKVKWTVQILLSQQKDAC